MHEGVKGPKGATGPFSPPPQKKEGRQLNLQTTISQRTNTNYGDHEEYVFYKMRAPFT